MKKLIYFILIACVSAAIIYGCTDTDSILGLNQEPFDELSQDAVFSDTQLTSAFLTQLYNGMGNGFVEQQISSFTDEAHFTHGRGSIDIVQSRLTPSNLGGWVDDRVGFYHWPTIFENIRNVNIFLENIEGSAIDDEAVKERMTGEAHYLRAWFYWLLLRQWGGVPVIEGIFALDDDPEDFLVERNTFGETVDFIVSEAEKAIARLPVQHSGSDVGRANAAGAMALKSRVLLFAASDLFHNVSEWAPGFSDPELVGYTNANQTEMWQDARDAAKDIIDLGVFDLYKANPAPDEDVTQNFSEVFLLEQHEEALFSSFFFSEFDFEWYEADVGLFNGPNGYRNWGGNAPIQNLVDDFEMEDGTEFDWNNPAHAEAPFDDRDPRFYATVMHDRSEWSPRLPGIDQQDPFGRIQTFKRLEVVDESGNVISSRGGLDSRNSTVEDWNGTFTGYILRKFIDPNVVHAFEVQEGAWHYFRFAEILLNYAEASIELGMEQDARDAINRIRRRVNMPEINDTGEALVERYRNERRVELAFEEHRYFDTRRWMIAPIHEAEDAFGITLEAELLQGEPIINYEYTRIEVEPVQERSWDDKMYFMPIPRDEINRNNKLVQNPNY